MSEAGEAREDRRELIDRAMDRVAGTRPIPGNRITLLYDGPTVYPAMLQCIERAERWIHLDNYIIRSDATGRRFADALIERARAGIPVRLLTDWVGSMTTRPTYWRRLRDAGVEIRKFNPPHLFRFRLNLTRDHRKILVVDGKCAITGGLCIGDEWAGRLGAGRQPWRDTGIQIEGPAAAAMDRVFDGVWRQLGPGLEESELVAAPFEAGSSAVRIVEGEPGEARASRATELLLAGAVERIWITDAYLIAPPGLNQSMLDAARGGVDVRLLVPGISDLPRLQNWTRVGYLDMLRAGIKIYEWRGPMLHAKTIVVDGRWFRVGSSNLNLSSLVANYEIDVVGEDDQLAQGLEAQFRRDIDKSSEIRLRVAPRRGAFRTRATLSPEPVPSVQAHRPGIRERRGRAVVAVQQMFRGAKRSALLPIAIILTLIGVLFLFFPQTMGVIFAVLSLWLALNAWLDSQAS